MFGPDYNTIDVDAPDYPPAGTYDMTLVKWEGRTPAGSMLLEGKAVIDNGPHAGQEATISLWFGNDTARTAKYLAALCRDIGGQAPNSNAPNIHVFASSCPEGFRFRAPVEIEFNIKIGGSWRNGVPLDEFESAPDDQRNHRVRITQSRQQLSKPESPRTWTPVQAEPAAVAANDSGDADLPF